ncbi:MAG: PilZ domain-containing protein [Pseudomonadales bacterium]|nr:PilZ domain-containing protein [Pseudomonadales bacterium]
MVDIQKNYSEKRDFIRMKVNAEVTLIVSADGKEISGKCKDLSGAGMLVEIANEEISVGSQCLATIKTTYEKLDDPDFKARIEITRVDNLETGGQMIGASIIEILQ